MKQLALCLFVITTARDLCFDDTREMTLAALCQQPHTHRTHYNSFARQ